MGRKGIPSGGNRRNKGAEAKTKESKSKQTKEPKKASQQKEASLVLEACGQCKVRGWKQQEMGLVP